MFAAKRQRIRSATGSIAEFGPAVAVFLIVILFPLINLIGLAYGMSTVFLIAHQCASQAGASANYSQALVAAVKQARELTQSGMGKFAKLKAVRGYANSGVDLYVYETNITTSEVHVCGPNELPPAPVDPSNNVYQILAQFTCDMGPFVDLSNVPILGDISGIGKPAKISYGATVAVEHPEGIVFDDGSSVWIQGGNGIKKGAWREAESGTGNGIERDVGSFRR